MDKINVSTVGNLRLSNDVLLGSFLDTLSSFQKKNEAIVAPSMSIGINNQNIANANTIGYSNTVHTDYSLATGENTEAGTLSFKIISGDMADMSWTLDNTDGIAQGMTYSVRLINNYDILGNIVSVDTALNKIYVDGMPWQIRIDENLSDEYLSNMPFYMANGNGLRGHPSNFSNEFGEASEYEPICCFYDDWNFDVNTLWIVGHPELGTISAFSTGCQSKGYGTCAQKQWSNSEGVYTIASGKYSHAEGNETIAGYAAHSEGYSTVAAVNGSHAEGRQTSCYGYYSHAEGIKSCILRNHHYSYAYNGDKNSTYYSHGAGTFNINPINGVDGVYVGDSTLRNHISSISYSSAIDAANSISSSIDDIVENLLMAILDLSSDIVIDKLWKGNIFELSSIGKERLYYSQMPGLSDNGTTYGYPYAKGSSKKLELQKILKLDSRISCVGNSVDTTGSIVSGFSDSTNLIYANIQNVKKIGPYAFYKCASLSSIDCQNLNYIDKYAFRYCSALSSISLPNVNYIAAIAFTNCINLVSVDFSRKTDNVIPRLMSSNAFNYTSENLSIFVPSNLLNSWQNAANWIELSSKIYGI